MEQTVLIKRSIEKDGKPLKTGEYFVLRRSNAGLGEYQTSSCYDKANDDWSNSGITHWYEPMNQSKLSEVMGLPSEDDVNLLANKRDTIEAAESFIDCYAWLIPIAQQVIAKERESAEFWKKEFDSQVHKCNAVQMELNKAKEQLIEADKTHKFLDGLIDKSISREAAIKVELDKAKEDIERLKGIIEMKDL